MQNIKNDLKSFQLYDWLIMLVTTSLFLPHTVCVVIVTLCTLYTLIKGNLIDCIRHQEGNKWMYLFVVLEMAVSLFYKNWTGASVMLSVALLFIFMAFFQRHVHPKLFQYMIEWSIILMAINGLYSLYQFNAISVSKGYSFFDFHIFNSPKRRITATFQNANIYALMIEMVLACILYRFLQTKKIILKCWYVVLALFEFGLIMLTGCRAALVPLIFVIPVMLIFTKEYKLLIVYLVCLAALLAVVFLHPSLIPRFDDVSTIESRFKIWKTAIKGIKKYPIFGMGPWTYNMIYEMFDGHKAVFCHNIYLDCVLSFGIVGCIVLTGYVVSLLKQVKSVFSKNRLLFSLIVSMAIIIMIHGLMDGTINPFKTNMFALMIASTNLMVAQNKTEEVK